MNAGRRRWLLPAVFASPFVWFLLVSHWNTSSSPTFGGSDADRISSLSFKLPTRLVAGIKPPGVTFAEVDKSRVRVMQSASSAADSAIPRLIWQTYKTAELPTEAAEAASTWTFLNPTHKYNFMDDAAATAFIHSNFTFLAHNGTTFAQVWDRLPIGVMKGDVWRYAVLYIYGGVYADIDAACIQPIDEWLPRRGLDQCGLVVGLENDGFFCNWAFASRPRHPYLLRVLELITARGAAGFKLANPHFVHFHTGPGVFTDGLRETLGCGAQHARGLYEAYSAGVCDGYRGGPRYPGACLVPYGHFNKFWVKNLYGSQNFKGGYIQWTKEQESLAKPEPPPPPQQPSPPPSPPEPPPPESPPPPPVNKTAGLLRVRRYDPM